MMKQNIKNLSYGTEEQLTMTREKPRRLSTSLSYKLSRIATKLFGRQRLLHFYLNGSWLLWRFAFESSGEIYGNEFHLNARGLSEEILKKYIPEDGKVIDIGCSVGGWCRIASKYAQRVVGIDYNKSLIKRAKEQTDESNIEYIVGDVTKDLNNEKFDLALLIHVIEHIEDADTILEKLQDVASTLIIEVPDMEQDPLNWVRIKNSLPFYTDGDHIREYTLEILTDQLARNGWQVLEYRRHGGAIAVVAKSVK